MRWILVVAVLALSGCSLRLYGDASMLKKYDRQADSWTVETKDGAVQATKVEGTK